jgi:D-aminopeptidase
LQSTKLSWRKLAGQADMPASFIYGGDKKLTRENVSVIPWAETSKLAQKFNQ